jgi:MFS family permease
MTDQNPYEAPLIVAEPASGEQERTQRGKRPLGVWILAILNLLIGMLGTVVFAFLVILWWRSPSFRFFPIITVLTIGLLFCFLNLASAVELWRGTRWGWWLAAIDYAWMIAGSALNVGTLAYVGFRQPLGDASDRFVFNLISNIIYGAISGACLLYLYNRRVRQFCVVRLPHILVTLLILFVASAGILALTALVMYLETSRNATSVHERPASTAVSVRVSSPAGG